MVKNTKGGSSHKKMARKNEDNHKELKIDLQVNFKTDNLIILIDKNHGNCFTAKILFFLGDKKKYPSMVRVLHQRGFNSKKVFDRTQSRIALVSLVNDFKLEGGCIGYVEELLIIDHLNAYLAHGLIDKETFDILNENMNAKADEKGENKKLNDGFEFERSKNHIEEKEKNLKDATEIEKSINNTNESEYINGSILEKSPEKTTEDEVCLDDL